MPAGGGGRVQVRARETLRACPLLALDSCAGGREGVQKVIPKQQLSKQHQPPSTITIGNGSCCPKAVRGALAGLVLRSCGPKWAVPGH